MLADLFVRPNVVSTDMYCELAVNVVSVDAFVAGAVPDPNEGETDASWLTRKLFIRNTTLDTREYHFDIRTARRIPGIDYTFVATIANSTSSANTFEFSLAHRVLLKLP